MAKKKTKIRKKISGAAKKNKGKNMRKVRSRNVLKSKKAYTRKQHAQNGSTLEKVFGPVPKVRLLNLFFRNDDQTFGVKEISQRTKLAVRIVGRECDALTIAGILSRHSSGAKRSYRLNISFPFAGEFRNLVQRSFPVDKNKLIAILKRAGKLRFILVSGIFLNREDSPVDLFVVGDGLSEKKLETAIRELEAIIGKDLRWAGMDTQEFLYRWRMFDRFLHDMLAAQHEKLLVSKLNFN